MENANTPISSMTLENLFDQLIFHAYKTLLLKSGVANLGPFSHDFFFSTHIKPIYGYVYQQQQQH